MSNSILWSTDGIRWSDTDNSDTDNFVWPTKSSVSRIIIGKLQDATAATPITLAQQLPNDLQFRFRELKQLCLWGLTDLTELPALPQTLVSLEIRDCPQLQTLHGLPRTLDDLYLQNCPRLAVLPDAQYLQNLHTLALPGCSAIPQSWIITALANNTSLRRADLSGCSQLTEITSWPDSLQDLRLNNCSELSSLPDPWPAGLTHLEIQHVRKLIQLPNFADVIDYLDLRWTAGWNTLPPTLVELLTSRQPPRTLLLYGSRLSVPPASEHGKDPDENVAHQTAEYFQHVNRLGAGEADQAKVLILGNGDAGKSCLASNLMGHVQDYRKKKKQLAAQGRSISTHGVQFWRKDNFSARIAGNFRMAPLQIWDFGGQEIYHNTHRLFISRGSVFVVVWDPAEQAGSLSSGSGTTPADSNYLDVKRPLRYWLDLILHACDSDPEIVLVCSRRSTPEPELENYWKSQLPPQLAQLNCITCLYIDSYNEIGQLEQLNQWLVGHVGRLLEREGTAVSADWARAQGLVQDLLKQASQTEHDQTRDFSLSLQDFHLQLQQKLQHEPRTSRLGQAIQAGWKLSLDRTRQTLRYLTRVGLVYWDPDLLEEQVIIGQQWALDGLYTVLNRDQQIYNVLKDERRARFRQSDLGEWGWNSRYSSEQQKLLISFMQSCGLCFELYTPEQAWFGQSVYLSFEHLPTAEDARLQFRFDAGPQNLNLLEQSLQRPRMHKLDWQKFLTFAGRTYGDQAEYAADGLLFSTKQEQSVLILCELDQRAGFGGEVKVRVRGLQAGELLQQVLQQLQTIIPDGSAAMPRTASTPEASIPRDQLREAPGSVFLSYAWNSDEQPSFEYEEPVNRIEELLRTHGNVWQSRSADSGKTITDYLQEQAKRAEGSADAGVEITVLRDRTNMKAGDSIVEFMQNGARCDRIILIHSMRYWKSPHCMYELWKVREDLLDKYGKSFVETVIPVELENSRIRDANAKDAFLKFWQLDPGTEKLWVRPTKLSEFTDDPMMSAEYSSSIRYYAKKIDDATTLNLIWSSKDNGDSVIESLRLRLGLPSRPLESHVNGRGAL